MSFKLDFSGDVLNQWWNIGLRFCFRNDWRNR